MKPKMKKENKYEKVVEYSFYHEPNETLLWMAIAMIPIIGQMIWIMCLCINLVDRKVYWRKVK